ncbi:MAG TPA: primosomal replication protein N [Gallionellaceae bacterium]
MNGAGCNRLVIAGQLVELDVMRYTPAGIARIEMKIRHASRQQEAGAERQVQCEITALALGAAAQQAARLAVGQQVQAEGFLAQRSLRNTQLILHIEHIE